MPSRREAVWALAGVFCLLFDQFVLGEKGFLSLALRQMGIAAILVAVAVFFDIIRDEDDAAQGGLFLGLTAVPFFWTM